jgi:ribose transport system permease protein
METDTPPAATARQEDRGRRGLTLVRRGLARYGLLVAFGAAVAGFSLARPDTFATGDNFKTILAQAAPSLILAAGLTVVLAM